MVGGSNLHPVISFKKIFYEKEKFDDLWAHHHGLHSQPSDTYWAKLGKKNITIQRNIEHKSFYRELKKR